MIDAEKLVTIAGNVPNVYKNGYDVGYAAGQEAGGGGVVGPNLLNYVSANWTGNFNSMFHNAKFPDGYEVTLDITNAPKNISSMFRVTVGLRKLTFIVPADEGAYAADYFLFGSSSGTSTIEELVLPDGIQFSKFTSFALNSRKLRTIDGAIDLSESTSNENCFGNCPELIDVQFVESTIKSSLYIKQSPNLSADTIDSLVKGLTTADTLQDLSLHSTVINKLTPEQRAIILNNNFQAI